MVCSHLDIDCNCVLQVKMVIPEASKEKLDDILLLGRQITFIYLRYLKILIPVVVYLKLLFPSLL